MKKVLVHKSNVDHPAHYGGKDNPYEAIKVIEAWNLGFCLGNTIKYISRAEKKGAQLEDLKKAAWYLAREIRRLEKTPLASIEKLVKQMWDGYNIKPTIIAMPPRTARTLRKLAKKKGRQS